MNPTRPAPRRTRAVVGLVAAVLASAASLAACGSSDEDSPSAGGSAATSESFTWTDNRGETVKLDHKPTAVVAQSSVAAALWDAGYQVAGVYGELGEVDGKLNYQAGNLDLSKVKVIGKTYGEFDEVAYAGLKPDLLIDFNMTDKDLWYVPAKQAKTILGLAPSIGLKGQGFASADEAIGQMTSLAKELGGQTDGDAVAKAKEAYDAAVADVKAAAADKADVTVALVSVDPNGLYVWNPEFMPEAQTLAAQGVKFVKPEDTADSGGWSELLSWENAAKYHADVIMVDARTPVAQAEKVATWKRLPAVKAGQVYEWKTAAPYSYAQYGPIFEDVAGWFKDVKPVQ